MLLPEYFKDCKPDNELSLPTFWGKDSGSKWNFSEAIWWNAEDGEGLVPQVFWGG